MDFITKLDYSNNRQIKQFKLTDTILSGTTEFGVPFSALTSGVNTDTVITTSVTSGITSTFSGNSTVTQITFTDPRMVVGSSSLEPITNLTSGTTQLALGFEGKDSVDIDGNIVNLTYTGSTFDFTITSIESDGFSGWTGTAYSDSVIFLSGSSLDYAERTIWVDVRGITRTDKLILGKLPVKDNHLTAVLGRQVNGDVVEVDLTQINTVYEGTYAELSALIADDALIVGNKYILTDYQTVYQIENTNTAPIIKYFTVNGNASGWSYFDPGIPPDDLGLWDVVTISALPVGYTGGLYVGQTAQVVNWYNEGYMIFSPTLLVGGIEIKTNKQRWPQVTNNEVILDVYGNVIMKPLGVLNTEVHNDLPYMSMTGAQNPSPLVEQIVLTSIDINKFSIDAESLTYQGDRLEYYFEENEIYDENYTFITNRNGFITRRTNIILNISVDKDWRVQRYRRWLMEPDIWSGYTHQQDVYKISGRNVCTTVNTSIGNNHKYILLRPYSKAFYLDFSHGTSTYGGLNPFISGTTYNPDVRASGKFDNDIAPEYAVNVMISYSGLTNAKDFLIFPIQSGVTNVLVTKFNVKNLSNSIFLTNSCRYGLSGDISVNSDGGIYDSSFMTGLNISAPVGGNLWDVTAIDTAHMTMSSTGVYMNKVHMFRFGEYNNNGSIFNTSFGASTDGINDYCTYTFDGGCDIRNSVFGDIRGDNVLFNSVRANKLLYKFKMTGNNVITGNMYLTQIECGNDTWGSKLDINTWYNINPVKVTKYGYYYPITGGISGLYVNNILGKKNIVHELADSLNVIQLITKSTLQ